MKQLRQIRLYGNDQQHAEEQRQKQLMYPFRRIFPARPFFQRVGGAHARDCEQQRHDPGPNRHDDVAQYGYLYAMDVEALKRIVNHERMIGKQQQYGKKAQIVDIPFSHGGLRSCS